MAPEGGNIFLVQLVIKRIFIKTISVYCKIGAHHINNCFGPHNIHLELVQACYFGRLLQLGNSLHKQLYALPLFKSAKEGNAPNLHNWLADGLHFYNTVANRRHTCQRKQTFFCRVAVAACASASGTTLGMTMVLFGSVQPLWRR